MKYFTRIFTGCAICFLGVMAGCAFARGDIDVGVFELCLAATNFPYLFND